MTSPCPSPAEDLAGFLTWHRTAFGAATMTQPAGDGGAGGAAGGDGGQGGAGAQGGGAAGSQGNERTFTQAEVAAVVARAEGRGKSEAETELGLTLAEAKQIIAERKASDDANKTQAERDAAAAATAKTDAERIKTEAAQDRHDARVERLLGQAGLDTGNDTLRLAGLAAINVAVGSDEATVKAAVEKAKTDAPALFGAPGTSGGGTHSDAGGQRRDQQAPAGEFGGKGAEEAKRRWGTPETAKTG